MRYIDLIVVDKTFYHHDDDYVDSKRQQRGVTCSTSRRQSTCLAQSSTSSSARGSVSRGRCRNRNPHRTLRKNKTRKQQRRTPLPSRLAGFQFQEHLRSPLFHRHFLVFWSRFSTIFFSLFVFLFCFLFVFFTFFGFSRFFFKSSKQTTTGAAVATWCAENLCLVSERPFILPQFGAT